MIIDGTVHCHITVSDTEKAVGGHLELGSTVFTFAVITLGVFDDSTSLSRVDDADWR
jgi:predicted DNA-binding protein with PD1-like motif